MWIQPSIWDPHAHMTGLRQLKEEMPDIHLHWWNRRLRRQEQRQTPVDAMSRAQWNGESARKRKPLDHMDAADRKRRYATWDKLTTVAIGDRLKEFVSSKMGLGQHQVWSKCHECIPSKVGTIGLRMASTWPFWSPWNWLHILDILLDRVRCGEIIVILWITKQMVFR